MLNESRHGLWGKRLNTLTAASALAVVLLLLALAAAPAQAEPSGQETEAATALKTYLENNLSKPAGDDAIQRQELSAAAVQPEWLMGPISSSYYTDPWTGLLTKYTMEQVGYYGTTDASYPRVGDLYYGVIGVGNATSNLEAYPIIDIKLPRDTRFDIDPTVPQKKIKCYLHNFNTGATQELTGNLCPTQPSTGIHGWNFNPPGGLKLDPGYMIELQFPLRSSKTLQGISDPTGGSCLVGAITVGFYDDVPEAGETCPLADNDGAYQGVFVSEALDTTPPNTTITSGPSDTVKSTSASFGFSSSEAGSKFQCSLDGAAFTACASPKSYTSLKNGKHTFKVRAIDAAGNVDATPAVRAWKVDTVKPTISGMSPKHGSITRDTTPTIKATVRDNMTNLAKGNIKLYVNGKLISASKYSYSRATDQLVYNSPKLSKGKKTVKIVATDAAKNVGAKSWYFTIK